MKVFLSITVAVLLSHPAMAEHPDDHATSEEMHSAVLHQSQCYQSCTDQMRQNIFATLEGVDRTLDLALKMLQVGSPEAIVAGSIFENLCLYAVANVLTLEGCYASCRDLETVHPPLDLESKTRFVSWFESEREPLVRAGLIDADYRVPEGADFENACAAYNAEVETGSERKREGLQSLLPLHLLPTNPDGFSTEK